MYIITGGAGFIGSAFLAKLNSEGINDILIVDELAHTQNWKNLRGKKFSAYLHKDEFLNLITRGKLAKKSIKAIIHMGACSSTTETNVDYLMRNNFEYSKTLATFALKSGARFIYASSAATYGAGEQGYDDADLVTPGLRPLNPYGFSKQQFDTWVITQGLQKKIVGLRFFNVFGPNEYHKADMRSVVLKSYEQIKSTGKVRLFKSHLPKYKDGEQMRDFVYIKDCIEVMWWLLKQPKVNGIFNLGSGRARTWKDLVAAVFMALSIPVKIEYFDMPETVRNQYQYFTQAKMNKIKAAGCKYLFQDLESSVEDYVLSYLERGEAGYL